MSTDWCLEAQVLNTANQRRATGHCRAKKQTEGGSRLKSARAHTGLTREGTSACGLHLIITNWDRAQGTDTGDSQNFDGNSTKSREIAPKLCTHDLYGVDEHSLRNQRPI
jgi:hypothetical protein